MAPWVETFLTVYALCVGLVVGSFLNVVIHRVPRRQSVVRPGSHCPACGHRIRWYDNVPVISWVLLRGRCRDCRAPIALRYPAVELATGIVTALLARRYGLSVAGAEAVLFAWVSIALGMIDLEHQLLPDVMTYPAAVLGLACSFAGGLATPAESIVGLAVGGLLPMVVLVAYKALRGIEGMGWGDVKYLAAIGAALGVFGCLWVLIAGAVLGAAVGLGLIVTGRGGSRTALPFGTFLAVAVLAWLLLPAAWRALPAF